MTLSCQNLNYSIGKKNLLHNITLTFAPGKIYGVLGPNGSGKSTLLRCLSGVYKAAGEIRLNGRPLPGIDRKTLSRLVTLVPQNSLEIYDFTVEEIVSMGRFAHSTPQNDLPYFIDKSLSLTDTLHLKKERLSTLSSGEKQRVYIARALATESDVLLLDEPSSCLDIRHELEIWELIRRLAEMNKTIVATLHNLVHAECFLNEVALLSEGRLLGQGSFQEIVTEKQLAEVFGVSTVFSNRPTYDLLEIYRSKC
jgi:iron complex transport system ATP-binding protein